MDFIVYDICDKFGTMSAILMPAVRAKMPNLVIQDHWREFVVGIISTITFMHSLKFVSNVPQSGK